MKKQSDTFTAIADQTGLSLNNAPAPELVVPREVRKVLHEVGQVLNAAITTQDAEKVLGEPWLTQLKDIHGQFNASIKDMPDTERVPAAQEAFYTLGYLKSQFLYLQNTIQNLLGSIKAKSAESAQALASVTSQVEAAVQAKINTGELVEKAKVSDLVAQAKKDGITEGANQGRLRFDRVMSLNSAKVAPEIVATIPEAVLLGEETTFNTAKDLAMQRIQKLSGVGLTVASMKNLPWEKPEIFDAQLATFTEIQANAGKSAGTGQSHNADKIPKPSGLVGGARNAQDTPVTATSVFC